MENKIKELEEKLYRKEQECEELKEKFQDMKKSRDVALKEYNEEFEYKRQITVEHLEQKKELLKQLDQLKAELEAYKMETEEGKEINAELKAENKHLNDLLNQALKELEQSREAIEKIKEIAEKKVAYFPDGEIFARPEIEQILQICDEVNEC